MRILGTDGLDRNALYDEISKGGKFVVYHYCISFLIFTRKKPSPIYFIRANQKTNSKGWLYTIISMLCGWWAIPFGPIQTIITIRSNLDGGSNVTREIKEIVLEGKIKSKPKKAPEQNRNDETVFEPKN